MPPLFTVATIRPPSAEQVMADHVALGELACCVQFAPPSADVYMCPDFCAAASLRPSIEEAMHEQFAGLVPEDDQVNPESAEVKTVVVLETASRLQSDEQAIPVNPPPIGAEGKLEVAP